MYFLLFELLSKKYFKILYRINLKKTVENGVQKSVLLSIVFSSAAKNCNELVEFPILIDGIS